MGDTLTDWRSETDEADIIQYEVEELIPPFVIRQLWHATEQTEKRVIVVTDVGQHQMWESQYYIHEHAGMLLTSGGLARWDTLCRRHLGRKCPTRMRWSGALRVTAGSR